MAFCLLMLSLWVPPQPTAPLKLLEGGSFTCATLAEAVNHFVDLGEAAAVKKLEALSVGWSAGGSIGRNERLSWICRILFQPKGKEPLRGPAYGAPELPYLSMPLEKWSLFPVASSGSSFFVLSEGYTLVGQAEEPRDYLKYCRAKGRFRTERVTVPTRAQALTDLEALKNSTAWKAIKWKDSGPGISYEFDEEWSWRFIKAQAESMPK